MSWHYFLASPLFTVLNCSSYFCKFIFFTKFGKLLTITTLNISLSHSLTNPPWEFNFSNIVLLNIVLHIAELLLFFSAFFGVSFFTLNNFYWFICTYVNSFFWSLLSTSTIFILDVYFSVLKFLLDFFL